MHEIPELEYAGFWLRTWAVVVDSLLMLVLLSPLVFFLALRAPQYLLMLESPFANLMSYVLPAALVLWFWSRKQATPGKMLIHARIVDAVRGTEPNLKQHVIRYLGYFLSTVLFGLGFLWIAFDRRKQGWHDKLAGTVVVRPRHGGADPVRFSSPARTD